MDKITLLGSIGSGFLLFAFAMVRLKKWKSEDFNCNLINLIGATLLVAYSIFLEAWPFVALNIVWGIFALRSVMIVLVKG